MISHHETLRGKQAKANHSGGQRARASLLGLIPNVVLLRFVRPHAVTVILLLNAAVLLFGRHGRGVVCCCCFSACLSHAVFFVSPAHRRTPSHRKPTLTCKWGGVGNR